MTFCARHPLLRRLYGLVVASAMLFWSVIAAPLHAGGGPENVFLVVNRLSWASQTVANQFIQLRQLPANNVFFVDWEESNEITKVEAFREKVLKPTLSAMIRRQLSGQIDYIVYSSDFPYAIDAGLDFKNLSPPVYLAPVGSLTGMTYLAEFVSQKNLNYLALRNNGYMRQASPAGDPAGPGTAQEFHNYIGWTPKGEISATGAHYVLSTMLAYTSGRGNSVPEAVEYLRRSASADGTRPKGTIYFMRNTSDEKRSAPRHNGFAEAALTLKNLGVNAVVEQGALPLKRNDVMGLMTGVRDFDWPSSGSTILPGAICEHLTSYGGDLSEAGAQTPLTEFLRYGAAGSSGTVYEPTAQPDKFPAPAMHIYYARGCTLAEAFYQAVHGPYQLLIVGDPLCRPWANIPQVSVTGFLDGDKISGAVKLTPSARFSVRGIVQGYELFVDGLRVGECKPDESLTLDTTKFPDGYHEVRVVAIEAGRIKSTGRTSLDAEFDNRGSSATVTSTPAQKVAWGQRITLAAKAPGAAAVLVFHNDRLVARIAGPEGETALDSRIMGNGPVLLRAFAVSEKNAVLATARPVELTIEPAEPLPARKMSPAFQLGDGLKLTLADKQTVLVQDTGKLSWMDDAGIKPDDEFSLTAYFEVPANEVYQFQLAHTGNVMLAVDDVLQYQAENGNKNAWRYVPVSLAKGFHQLQIQGKAASEMVLSLKFGGPGAYWVRGNRFKHLQ